MKELSLLLPQEAQEQQATSGGLTPSHLGQSMENRFLVQSSGISQALSVPLSLESHPTSCSFLHPSRLTSTTSTLLSTNLSSLSLTSPSFAPSLLTSPLFTSPLVSTENKYLKRDSLLSSNSLSLSSSHPPPCVIQPPVSLPVLEVPDGMDGGRRQSASEDVLSYSEEMSLDSDQEMEVSTQVDVLDMVLGQEELDQTVTIVEQQFGEKERGRDEVVEEVKDKKYLLLNELCCSLVNKSVAPGQKDWDAEDSIWKKMQSLATDISTDDPRFLLKAAVYIRQELNIRITANFLLALAAHLPATKPHVRRYFCAAVQLPSDWLEVVRIYSTCFSRSLPTCLKKALGDKFMQFTEYQLAKYNTRIHRCKHNHSKLKAKVSDTGVTAMCSMPDGQFAVACWLCPVSVWKLQWNPEHTTASLLKVSTHSVPTLVRHLCYCSFLLATFDDGGVICFLTETDREIHKWKHEARILGLVANDEKSTWVLVEKKRKLMLGFLFAMGAQTDVYSSCGDIELDVDVTGGGAGGWITAVTVKRDFVVCGDSKGNMWFNQPPNVASWTQRRPAHSDRISVLRMTDHMIISASHDRTVKMWDRITKKQVGVFVCAGPVLLLEINPQCFTELVCGDALGQLYFLSWRE
ncbi:hypothetical protein UPYG_G00293500 [Umbra pygmaea]|uniref:Telomerase protein component 1 n=1 Tax=Umbra pygmaea TaxID=75934 RepID=A0ABD0W638_UMBPY